MNGTNHDASDSGKADGLASPDVAAGLGTDSLPVSTEPVTSLKTSPATTIGEKAVSSPHGPHGAGESNDRPYSSFSSGQKWMIVGLAALAAIFAPMSSNIYVPALPQVSSDFNKSTQDIDLTLTIYLVFQAITPSIFAGMSDTIGRRPVLICCLVVYCVSCVGIALTPGSAYWLLMVLRCVQATGGSPPIGTGSGAMGDIATPAERGTYMGLFSGTAMLGPAIGPVIGGILVQWLSWRWIFWVLAILSGLNVTIIYFFMPETLRSIVGDGSIPPPALNSRPMDFMGRNKTKHIEGGETEEERKAIIEANEATRSAKVSYNPLNSFKMLFYPEVFCVIIFGSTVFSCVFAVLTVYSTVLTDDYHLDEVKIGLCYLAQGGGSLISGTLGGRLIDWRFRRSKAQLNFKPRFPRDLEGFPIEKVRYWFLPLTLPVFLAALIGFGWALETRSSLAVALVMNFFIGICNQFTMQTCSILLIDMLPMRAGAVVAAFNLVRCAGCAVISAIVSPLQSAVGLGWTFVIMAGLVLCTTPSILILRSKGPQWRAERRKQLAPKGGFGGRR